PPLPQANVPPPQAVIAQTLPQTGVQQPLTGETVAYWALLTPGMTSDQLLNDPGCHGKLAGDLAQQYNLTDQQQALDLIQAAVQYIQATSPPPQTNAP